MNEEDEAFNEIERKAKQRIEAVRAALESQAPVKIVQYNCICGKTMKFESAHGVVAPQRTWVAREMTAREISDRNVSKFLGEAPPAQRKPLTSKDFEEFVKAELGDIAVSDNGRYISPKIQNYWKIWEHYNTAPPAAQRTWVALTDEEMLECNMDGDLMIDRETAKRNVEAKLKEKNSA
jgi:hypothetical protein